jgi:hypothetical protein
LVARYQPFIDDGSDYSTSAEFGRLAADDSEDFNLVDDRDVTLEDD